MLEVNGSPVIKPGYVRTDPLSCCHMPPASSGVCVAGVGVHWVTFIYENISNSTINSQCVQVQNIQIRTANENSWKGGTTADIALPPLCSNGSSPHL